MIKGAFNVASFILLAVLIRVGWIRVGWVGWVGRFTPVLSVRVVLRVPVGTRGACLRVYVIGREGIGMTLVGLIPRLLLPSMLLLLLLLLLLMLFMRLFWL